MPASCFIFFLSFFILLLFFFLLSCCSPSLLFLYFVEFVAGTIGSGHCTPQIWSENCFIYTIFAWDSCWMVDSSVVIKRNGQWWRIIVLTLRAAHTHTHTISFTNIYLYWPCTTNKSSQMILSVRYNNNVCAVSKKLWQSKWRNLVYTISVVSHTIFEKRYTNSMLLFYSMLQNNEHYSQWHTLLIAHVDISNHPGPGITHLWDLYCWNVNDMIYDIITVWLG